MLLKNVVFNYTRIAEPVLKYRSKTDYEWKTDIVMSKAQFKELKTEAPKLAAKPKRFDREEYEEKYKTEAPHDDNYVLTVKQDTVTRKGKKMKAPRLFFKQGKKAVQDNSKLVGNGSKGAVVVNILDNEFEGSVQHILRLGDVVITDHVPYEAKNELVDAFGDLGIDGLEENEAPEPSEPKSDVLEDFDDDNVVEEDDDDDQDFG